MYMYMDMHMVKTERFIYCTGEVILAATGMGHSVCALLPSETMLHITVEMLEGCDETQLQSLPPQPTLPTPPSLPTPPPKRKQGTAGPPAKKTKYATRSGTHLPDWSKDINPNHPLGEL